MRKILITGGSGLLGREITAQLLTKGYAVNWLSRKNKIVEGVSVFLWDVDKGFIADEAFEGVDVIIHLAGEGIADKRWTKKRKEEIIKSRTDSTELLIAKMKNITHQVQTVICASAIGYYETNKHIYLTEENNNGNDFLAYSVNIWEAATRKFAETGVRLVQIRIGIVLSNDGGAFKELMQTRAFGILTLMGMGNQIYSWIHVEDVAGIFLFAMENKLSGVFNAVAPNPVSQKEITKQVKVKSGKPYIILPVPAFGLKMILGELSNTVLNSQMISSKKIMDAGYQFKYADIGKAMTMLV